MTQRRPRTYIARAIAVLSAVAVACFAVFFQRWTADGPSMWPGLYETRFVTLRTAFGSPQRGDVVVFRLPTEDATVTKRVVGVPGDTVEVRGGRVLVDGQPLGGGGDAECPHGPDWLGRDLLCWREATGDHRWLAARSASGGPSDMDAAPVVVPAGEYYLLGDMRTESNDSRNPRIGTVPLSRIEGRLVWGDTQLP